MLSIPPCGAFCTEEKEISVTPEVSIPPKKRAKRSIKPITDSPIQDGDSTIQTDLASRAEIPSQPDPKTTYDWDRTPAETAQKQERELARKLPFPSPPSTNVAFDQLCVYWNELQKLPVAAFAKLYVSRWWPVLLAIETKDDFGNAKESFPNDLTITKDDGELSERLVLQLAGVGEYRFRLNDTRRPWKQQTIVFSELNIIEQSLWQLHPPIFDMKRLDLDAKRNQAYIKFARAHGYLSREGDIQQEKDDMANAEVVTQLLQANKSLTEQVLKGPPPASPAAPVAVPVKAESNGNGESSAVKSMADVAIAIMNRESAPAADPIKMVESMVGMLKEISPKPDNSATDLAKEVVKAKQSSDDRMYELQKEQLAQARTELKEARSAINPQVLPAEAPRTRRQLLEDAVEEQKLLKQLAGGKSSAGEEESEKPGFADKWGDILPLIADPISAIVQSFFQTIQYGFQSWQQKSYYDALGRNGTPTPPMTMNPSQPNQPMPPQAPPPSPQQAKQSQNEQVYATVMQSVAKMTPYLIRHLDKGKSGAEFAEFIIENGEEERTSYDRVKALPETLSQIGVKVAGEAEDQFLNACRFVFEKYPPLWQKIESHPTIKQFLLEFYNYDAIIAEGQKEGDEQK